MVRWFTPRYSRTFHREERLLRDASGDILAVSSFVADQVCRWAGPCEERLHVLLNGVDADRFRAPQDPGQRATMRQSWGLGEDDVAFLFVAHNLRLKNLRLLTGVFADLHPACPHLKLVVVGKRAPRIQAPWLVYAGQTDRPEEAYWAGDALLHPTLYDACANVVLEAMASGLPVASSDSNGSAERIRNGESGWVLPVHGPGAATTWADLVRRLGTGSGLRAQVGQRAAVAATGWSMDQYVRGFESVLASALARQADKGQLNERKSV
jgi:UDP-glucose:(heptosyl)LPS alpha-1,3-glucosyltransferase